MIAREQAEAAIHALHALNPEALRLAEAVSLAVHIDKRLLRAARLALTSAGPEAEADLHFSALVRDAAPSGLVFHPEAAFLLRRRLQEDPDRMARAWQVVAARHPQLPATLRTEEQLQWHALRGETETVQDLLRACIGAMVEQGRPGFAAWAIDAVARMDPAARGLDEYRMLGLGAALRTGASQRQLADLADDRLAEWLAWLAPPAADRVKVGLALVEGGVEFGPASDPRYRHRIELPRRFPQVLELRDAGSGRIHAVTLREQAVVFAATDATELVITAEDGSRRRLSRQTKSRFIREDRLPRVHLEYEAEHHGARQKVSLPFVLGVMADLSGHNRGGRPPLEGRQFVDFTAEDFAARMAAIAPKLRLKVADRLGGGEALDLSLTFRTMADFHPDALAEAVPQIAAVLRLRRQVSDLMIYMDGSEARQSALEDLLESPARMLAMAGPDLSIPGVIASPTWAMIRRKLASGGFVQAMAHFNGLDMKLAGEGAGDSMGRLDPNPDLRALMLLCGWGRPREAVSRINGLLDQLAHRDLDYGRLQAYLLRQLALHASELKHVEAGAVLQAAYRKTRDLFGVDSLETGWIAVLLAEWHLNGRQYGEAMELLAQPRIIRPGARDPRLALRAALIKAEVLLERKQTDDARSALADAAELATLVPGVASPIRRELKALAQDRQLAEALPLLKALHRRITGREAAEKHRFRGASGERRAFRKSLNRTVPPLDSYRLNSITDATAELCSLLVDFPDLLSTDVFTTLGAATALIDRHLSEQVGLILRNPDFRQLERTWRGLHYLAVDLPPGPDVKLRVLDIGRDELPLALAAQGGTGGRHGPSPLHRVMHEAEFGQLGGQPYGAVICDFSFSDKPADLDVLAGLARQGEMSMAPFIAAAAPALLGKPNWAALDYRDPVEDALAGPSHHGWQALRDRPESRYLVLTASGMVARLMYGHQGDPVELFDFEEGNAPPLTMNAGWGLGVILAESFRTHGWFARIHGVETGGALEGLPTATFGVERERRATEAAISDHLEAELVNAGLMPLVARRGTADAAFISAPTVHRPEIYQDAAATASSALAESLPYVMTWSRFAHYAMCICRDRIGTKPGGTVSELAQDIQGWLDTYVDENAPANNAQAQARFPLKAARLEATYDDNGAGRFQFRLTVIPHFQFSGADCALSGILMLPFGDGA